MGDDFLREAAVLRSLGMGDAALRGRYAGCPLLGGQRPPGPDGRRMAGLGGEMGP
ncbi:MAG: hypothetical protein U0667_16360 [Chloroflexota bacterium]